MFLSAGLHQNSFYGSGRNLTKADAERIVHGMLAQGFLAEREVRCRWSGRAAVVMGGRIARAPSRSLPCACVHPLIFTP